MPFLQKEFPQLVESYQQRYKDRAFLPASYRKRLSQLMKRLGEKHGISTDYDRYSQNTHPQVAAETGQMNLF
jgi:hypothetical protein